MNPKALFCLNSTIHPIDNNEKQKDLWVIVDTKLFFEDQIYQVVSNKDDKNNSQNFPNSRQLYVLVIV